MKKKELIKKSTIKTGIFLSIVPVLLIIFFGFRWQVIIHMATYSIPLFFIRKLTFSKHRKHVFWIPVYLFTHTIITYTYLTSQIREYTPDSPADQDAYLILFSGLYGFIFMLLLVIFTFLIIRYYIRDKK